MRIEDYPPQEPLADYARPYHEEVLRRGAGVAYEEFGYGDNAYRGVLVARRRNRPAMSSPSSMAAAGPTATRSGWPSWRRR